MLFCGTGSFKDVDKDAGGKAAAQEAKKKKQGGGGKKENPYASRGLDKFSTVLSELESRREKILRRVGGTGEGGGGGGGGGGEHVLVRFVQSEGKGWVPIVVKLPPEEEQQQRKGGKKRKQAAATSTTSSQSSTPPTSEPASPREDVIKLAHPAAAAVAPGTKRKAGVRWSWSDVRPRHYMPFVAVLLLASLVVFGKVFAICCTSIWWYLVPILTTSSNGGGAGAGGEAHGVRRATKAAVKVLGKKASDKKIAVAPLLAPSHGKKGSSGVHELISPRSHPHGKKG
uniref:ZCF37 n=1 Tax=Oryza punctata TaxID=4537 RepID=A0A0E0LMS1_ORYPU